MEHPQDSQSMRLADPGIAPGALRLRVGDVLGERYRIQRVLGQGGFGVVYVVERVGMGKRFALKTIHPHLYADESAVGQLQREIKNLAEISHPNVVSIVDQGVTPAGAPYFVMDYVDGRSLLDVVREVGPLAPERVIALGIALCRGVEAIHRSGKLHRDIKPNNLLVSVQDGEERLTILDFGLSKNMDATEFTRAGTPFYVAPEVCMGGVPDRRSDVYSAAVTLFVLATSTYPGGQAIEGASRTCTRDALPLGLRAALEGGLAPHAERFPSMAALVRALTEAPRAEFRRGCFIGLLLLLLVTLGGLAVALVWSLVASDVPRSQDETLGLTPSTTPPVLLDSAGAKKEDVKQEDAKKQEPKEEPKKQEPKKQEPKKEEPKKQEPKKQEPKKQEPKKERVEPLREEELKGAVEGLQEAAARQCAESTELARVSGQLSVSPQGVVTVQWFGDPEPALMTCLKRVVAARPALRRSREGGRRRVHVAL